MSKLDVPTLKGPLDPANINAWLNSCADSYEAYSLMNPERKISPSLQVLFAGLKMEEEDAKLWWNENRESLKVLTTWADFASRVRERFVPANWRLDALARFFSTRQGRNEFRQFLAELQAARNALSSAGKGYTVTDTMFKNHLLFHANPILQLRVRALPSLNYADMKLNALVNLMQSTWISLVAEGVTSARAAPFARSQSTPASMPAQPNSAARAALSPLTDSEREKLRAAKGCFHCRRTPSSPGWTTHTARDCPGDPAHGIPPRSAPGVVASVSAMPVDGYWDQGDDDDIALTPTEPVGPDYQPQFYPRALVAAVLPMSVPPSCVLEGPDTESDEDY